MIQEKEFKFNANYSSKGTIRIGLIYCHLCNKDKEGIAIDSSDGEYGEGGICLECLNKEIK